MKFLFLTKISTCTAKNSVCNARLVKVCVLFLNLQSTSFRSDSASPIPCAPPEYLIAPYRSGNYEYVGVPLDHTQTDEESSGPSTAEIIASQSQDYVDEKLAEYQATIQQLQGEFYEAEEIDSFCNEIVLITSQNAQWTIIKSLLTFSYKTLNYRLAIQITKH